MASGPTGAGLYRRLDRRGPRRPACALPALPPPFAPRRHTRRAPRLDHPPRPRTQPGFRVTAVILAVDDATRSHLLVALGAHAHRCRRDGVPLPSALTDLIDGLSASGGQRGGQTRPSSPEPRVASEGDAMRLVNYRTAADTLRVSYRTVRRLVRDGALPAVGVGSARRIRAGDLAEFVERLDQVPGTSLIAKRAALGRVVEDAMVEALTDG
jgi:excisionase family DNA binding protein